MCLNRGTIVRLLDAKFAHNIDASIKNLPTRLGTHFRIALLCLCFLVLVIEVTVTSGWVQISPG